MKRLALVLTVAALAAVSCTTPGSVPVTTSSSSTTQAGASAREAVIPFDRDGVFDVLVDSSYYPSGATIQAVVSIGGQGFCVSVMDVGANREGPELPDTRSCGSDIVVGGGVYGLSIPIPLPAGEHVFVPDVTRPNGEDIGEFPGYFRIRW
jgi:hypothetical protein